MAKYKLKNDKLWQWDSGQLVEVPTGYEGYESQFYNKNHKDGIVVPTSSYTTESTKTYCPIPNQLLADVDDIAVFSFSKTTGVEHTETVTVLKVIERPKPSSYIYTPEEKKTWEQLSDRIADAEDDIDELDEGKADVNHTHDWDEIQDKPTEFPPSSHTHNQYLTDAPSDDKGYVRKNGAWAEESGATEVAWSDVTGKPTEFTPSAHEQGWDTITGKPTTFTPSAHNQGWDTITDKPESYTPSSHTHGWSEVTDKPSTFTPSSHTHTKSEVTDFAHNHDDRYYTESEVDSALSGKANTSHTHTKSQITDFPTLKTVATSGLYSDLDDAPEFSKSEAYDPDAFDWEETVDSLYMDSKLYPLQAKYDKDGNEFAHTYATKESVTAINGKIPSQASSSNQLADKDFVNSSIATNTAYYISNNGEPFTSLAQLQAYSGTVTNNDYAFVTGTDTSGNTYYDRYKATVNGSTVTWSKEFRLNNSSFTAVQWSAITSGITSALVGSYNTHIADSTIHISSADRNTWNGKQNALAFIYTSDGLQAINGMDLLADYNKNGDALATQLYVGSYHDSSKQDAISDLATIRTGATRGNTLTDSYINSLIDAKITNAIGGAY